MKKITQLKNTEILLVTGGEDNTSINEEVCQPQDFNLEPVYYLADGIVTALTMVSIGYYVFFKILLSKHTLIKLTEKKLEILAADVIHAQDEYLRFKYYKEEENDLLKWKN